MNEYNPAVSPYVPSDAARSRMNSAARAIRLYRESAEYLSPEEHHALGAVHALVHRSPQLVNRKRAILWAQNALQHKVEYADFGLPAGNLRDKLVPSCIEKGYGYLVMLADTLMHAANEHTNALIAS